jgi:hypothetical protein
VHKGIIFGPCRDRSAGLHPLFDARRDVLLVELADQHDIEMRARQLMEFLGVLWRSATLRLCTGRW